MRIARRELDAVSRRLESRTPLEILAWTHETFGRRAAILSSMQRTGSMLCHLADRAGLELDVLFVDTGVLHPETLATRDELARTHRRLSVVTLAPERSFADQTKGEGLLYLSKEGQERCCELRKTEPLRKVKGRYDALVVGLRRGEGAAREGVGPIDVDPEQGVLRIHPLFAATSEEVEAYLALHPDVAQNPLHAMGFPSIGCFPCTTPVRPDEPERAGRWRHLAGVSYCGINPADRGDPGSAAVELDDRYTAALRP